MTSLLTFYPWLAIVLCAGVTTSATANTSDEKATSDAEPTVLAPIERAEVPPTDRPPPSTWDRRQERKGAGDSDIEASDEGISWGAQLLKTVVALLIVVGLIYLLFKIGLARFVGMAAIRPGKSLKVIERVQLDARHALVIIEIDSQRRMLLGTGEQGVQVLASLDGEGEVRSATRGDFERALDAAASASAGDGSTHADS